MKTVFITYKGSLSFEKDANICDILKNFAAMKVGSAYSVFDQKRSLVFDCPDKSADKLENIKQSVYEKYNLEIEIIPF